MRHGGRAAPLGRVALLGALAPVLLVAVGAGASPSELACERPCEIMKVTAEQVLVILQDKSRDTRQRRDAIEEIAYERFDFTTMSRLVLGRRWKKLSDDQKVSFEKEFTTYLANDYGSRLDRYGQEEVEIKGERKEPRGDVTVKTVIVGGNNDGALVDYRMRFRNEEWRIIDVTIEGISLISNFRDQFREVMGRGGAENLLEKLREKNQQLASAPAGT